MSSKRTVFGDILQDQSACESSEKTGVKLVDAHEREIWDGFVAAREEANFLQSWDFYEFHAARGREVVRRLAYKGDKIVGAYAGVVETAKRGRYLAIAGGPLADLSDKELVAAIFKDIKVQGVSHDCVFVRVRPQWKETAESLDTLRALGLKRAPMYLSVEYAGILDLRESEEEILAGASQGFRRKLRKAEKLEIDGARIEVGWSDSKEAIAEFCELEKLHAERQKYVAFSSEFLTKQFEAFARHGEVLIYTARLKGEILAQNFMIFYGSEASYHYGVSSALGTKFSAAPLLHLAAMHEARKRGCKRYNLWGIVGVDEKDHRFYGVSEFKRSFGVTEFRYTPAHDLVLKPLKYRVTWTIETLRKKWRHV